MIKLILLMLEASLCVCVFLLANRFPTCNCRLSSFRSEINEWNMNLAELSEECHHHHQQFHLHLLILMNIFHMFIKLIMFRLVLKFSWSTCSHHLTSSWLEFKFQNFLFWRFQFKAFQISHSKNDSSCCLIWLTFTN